MDPLTQVLDAPRARDAFLLRVTMSPPWSVLIKDRAPLAVVAVTSGEAWFEADGKRFLMNPKWRHFARIKASELLLLDADDRETMSRPDAPDASAWCIHGHLHGALLQARCILHVHPPYATAIASLSSSPIPR